MKILSSTAEAERLKCEQDVIWLMEIDWPDQTRYYATREVAIGSHLYAAMITDPGEMVLSAPADHPLKPSQPDRARMKLSNRADDVPRFEALGLSHDPTGLICRVGMLFVTQAVAPEDVINFQWFVITHARFDNREAELTMQSMTLFGNSPQATRVLTESLAPRLSPEALGKALPLCFGDIDHSPLVPLRIGARARLSRALGAADTVAYLSALDGFAPTGWAQVGGELIYYADVDQEAKTLGTPLAPLTRSAPAEHSIGSRVASVPSEGFEYAVADHECLEAARVCFCIRASWGWPRDRWTWLRSQRRRRIAMRGAYRKARR
ncbi:MAG: hypothetical protein NTX50_06820 [Candidatus Sumerlaeota bacterium]|nr:hypothetical protein [Candidatus Sumerlaeota bacterium]